MYTQIGLIMQIKYWYVSTVRFSYMLVLDGGLLHIFFWLLVSILNDNSFCLFCIREHALRNSLAKGRLKTTRQQNRLSHCWVLHLTNIMTSSLPWSFQIIPMWWNILIMKQIKSWRLLLFKVLWKIRLKFQQLKRYRMTHCLPFLSSLLLNNAWLIFL